MRRSSASHPGLLALAVIGGIVTAFVTASPSVSADRPKCGVPGRPPCPMQQWMRTRMSTPYAKSDLDELATAFDELIGLNPRRNGWGRWNGFARRGAEAARKGNRDRVLELCTHCHKSYRRAYNRAHRERKLPEKSSK
jgi:hypothetical protein